MSYAPTSKAKLELQDGSTWRELNTLVSISFSPGEPSSSVEENIQLDRPSRTVLTSASAGTASIEAQVAEGNRFWRVAEAAFRGSTELNFRSTVGVEQKVAEGSSNSTLALASNGTVTAAGSSKADFGSNSQPNAPWDLDKAITNASVCYIIDSITDGDTLVVTRYGGTSNRVATPDSTALAAFSASSSWELHNYAIRKEFSAQVTSIGGDSLSTGGARTDTISLSLSAFPTRKLVLGA